MHDAIVGRIYANGKLRPIPVSEIFTAIKSSFDDCENETRDIFVRRGTDIYENSPKNCRCKPGDFISTPGGPVYPRGRTMKEVVEDFMGEYEEHLNIPIEEFNEDMAFVLGYIDILLEISKRKEKNIVINIRGKVPTDVGDYYLDNDVIVRTYGVTSTFIRLCNKWAFKDKMEDLM